MTFERYRRGGEARAAGKSPFKFARPQPEAPGAVTEWGARCRDCPFATGPVSEESARRTAANPTADGHVIDVVTRTVTPWEVTPDGNDR
jgi:hypothetical protein